MNKIVNFGVVTTMLMALSLGAAAAQNNSKNEKFIADLDSVLSTANIDQNMADLIHDQVSQGLAIYADQSFGLNLSEGAAHLGFFDSAKSFAQKLINKGNQVIAYIPKILDRVVAAVGTLANVITPERLDKLAALVKMIPGIDDETAANIDSAIVSFKGMQKVLADLAEQGTNDAAVKVLKDAAAVLANKLAADTAQATGLDISEIGNMIKKLSTDEPKTEDEKTKAN